MHFWSAQAPPRDLEREYAIPFTYKTFREDAKLTLRPSDLAHSDLVTRHIIWTAYLTREEAQVSGQYLEASSFSRQDITELPCPVNLFELLF